ncbi:MAG: hypothetical protein P9X27_02140 [Candidatus Kaelpia aquatica]|nr:hypothetical protein [Candidatus Kaelpia aquatica]
MRFYKVVLASLFIVLVSIGQVLSEDLSLGGVLEDIKGKVENIDSYRADIEMVFKSSEAESTISGDISYVKPDKMRVIMGVKGREDARQSIYSDGEEIWQYMPLFKIASKVDLSILKEEFQNTEDLIKNQNNMQDVTSNMIEPEFLGIEDLGQERVYVIKGLIKEGGDPALDGIGKIETVKAFISLEDGMQRKMEYYDASGKLLFYQSFYNVEINVNISDETFKFKVPEGVNILDTTPQAREMLRESQLNE